MLLKKTSGIFFSALLLFQLFGYFYIYKAFVFHIQKDVEKRIESGIADSLLTKLVFNNYKELEEKVIFKENNPKEFYYQDKLFDIVNISEEAGQLVCYCIDDTKEKALEDSYKDILGHHNTDHANKMWHFFHVYYSFTDINNQLKLFLFEESHHYFYKTCRLAEGISKNPDPPPKA